VFRIQRFGLFWFSGSILHAECGVENEMRSRMAEKTAICIMWFSGTQRRRLGCVSPAQFGFGDLDTSDLITHDACECESGLEGHSFVCSECRNLVALWTCMVRFV
jgi:hypothetical protein